MATFLSQGFRPFFLLAAAYAVLLMVLWLGVLYLGWPAPGRVAPSLWHGHELIFGFAAAAAAGFLLTAMPEWTGSEPLRPGGLGFLLLIWIAGRAAMWAPDFWPAFNVGVLDLAFVPALALYAAAILIMSRNWRNLVLVAILAVLTAGNVLFHAGNLEWANVAPGKGLLLAINGFVLLIAIIGGRVIPLFTANALDRQGQSVTFRRPKGLSAAALLTVAAIIPADLVDANSTTAAAVTLTAAVANALRLLTWQSERTLKMPIVWVLHLAYFWLVAGLFMKGLAASLPALSGLVWVHALTIGAMSTMILAVMTRAALGHTGRPLVAARPVAWAYGMVSLSALARILSSDFPAPLDETGLFVAGALWIIAYAIFVIVYWPILTRANANGAAANQSAA